MICHFVGYGFSVGVILGVGVLDGVKVAVGVKVSVGVGVMVGVGVSVGVGVGVGVGWIISRVITFSATAFLLPSILTRSSILPSGTSARSQT